MNPDIRIKERIAEDGKTKEFFAIADCPQCGGSFTNGTYGLRIGAAVQEAREGLADHRKKYPNCKRPNFDGVK